MNECNKTFSDVFEQNEEISQKLSRTKFRRVNSLAQAKMQDVLKKSFLCKFVAAVIGSWNNRWVKRPSFKQT